MEIQSYVAELAKAYVQHTKKLTETGEATLELPTGPAGFLAQDFTGRAGTPGARSDAGGPKKRKRAPADPNAPKRALTPYFLYMKHNRSKIAADLGKDVRPKEVADEGTRRWQAMDASEREVSQNSQFASHRRHEPKKKDTITNNPQHWKSLYTENYNKYKEDVAAYKAGTKTETAAHDDEEAEAENEHEDPAASQLQQDFAGAETKEDSDASTESSDEESPSPVPVKEKTPPRSSAKKTRKAKEVETPAKSPVKRGRKAAAAAAEPEPTPAKTPVENKRRSKKRKSEA